MSTAKIPNSTFQWNVYSTKGVKAKYFVVQMHRSPESACCPGICMAKPQRTNIDICMVFKRYVFSFSAVFQFLDQPTKGTPQRHQWYCAVAVNQANDLNTIVGLPTLRTSLTTSMLPSQIQVWTSMRGGFNTPLVPLSPSPPHHFFSWVLTQSGTVLERHPCPVSCSKVYPTNLYSMRTMCCAPVSLGGILPVPYCLKARLVAHDCATAIPVGPSGRVHAGSKMCLFPHT